MNDMTGGFASYTSYEPQPEPFTAPQGASIRVHDTVYRNSSSDGMMIESSAANASGNSGELNPHHGDGSILSTARNANGSPVSTITADTLVEMHGVQAPVSVFVSEGLMEQAPNGTFREATGQPQAAPEAAQGDFLPMSEASMASVNAALASVEENHMDALIGTATGMAAGRLTADQFVQKFAQVSGLEAGESNAQAQTMIAAYQAHADEALMTRSGIPESELPAFYAWAKVNAQGALQEAVHKQMRMHDVSGYQAIAAKWVSQVAPTLDAFKRAGVPTRTQGQGSEVFLKGQWMSPGAAAKAGLV